MEERSAGPVTVPTVQALCCVRNVGMLQADASGEECALFSRQALGSQPLVQHSVFLDTVRRRNDMAHEKAVAFPNSATTPVLYRNALFFLSPFHLAAVIPAKLFFEPV